MLVLREYDRASVLEYARRWALSRNPLFIDFKGIGGDCTNFISQCVLAGSCQMNFTPTFGWYYIDISNRAPAWTGVPFFYNFMTSNTGVGPYGIEAGEADMEIGDVIQLGRRDGTFYHTLVITGFDRRQILVSTHTDDAYDRPLSTYNYQKIRYIHMLGARVDLDEGTCVEDLLDGTALPVETEMIGEEISPEPDQEPSDEEEAEEPPYEPENEAPPQTPEDEGYDMT